MRVTNLPQAFKRALPILEKIQAAGFEAYFVGGSVRDTILNLPIHDVDIATSAYPAEIKELFAKTVDTGIEHGTVMVIDHGIGYEITTFRTESTYQDFRRPDKVEFVRSLKEDLKRRDLTINALALRPDGEVIDLFNGLADLESKTIRAVGQARERFHEDALRMMRTVRFASQLDFEIEAQTLAAIKENAALLAKIALERINVEWVKLMLGKNPKAGLADFMATGLFAYCPQFKEHQAQLNSLLAIENLHLDNEAEVWTLLAACFDYHPEQGGQLVHAWKGSNELKAQVTKALRALEAMKAGDLSPKLQYLTGSEMLAVACRVARLLGLADYSSMAVLLAYEGLPIHSRAELAVNGKDLITLLNLKPGPILGQLLDQIEEAVLNRQVKNDKLALLEYGRSQLEEWG